MEIENNAGYVFIAYVKYESKNNDYKKRALYRCSCGDENILTLDSFKTKPNRKCKKCTNKENLSYSTHKLSKHPLYSKWNSMKNRCYRPTCQRYKNYGGIGIQVCKEWKDSYLNFYNWSLDNGWKQGLSIERKDNFKDYCPENCIYIPLEDQHHNRKNTFWIKYKGVEISLSKFTRDTGFKKRFVVYNGMRKGISLDFYLEKIEGFKDSLNLYIVEKEETPIKTKNDGKNNKSTKGV